MITRREILQVGRRHRGAGGGWRQFHARHGSEPERLSELPEC